MVGVKKNGNPEGRGGLTILEFGGHEWVEHFGISKGKRQLKC